MVQTDDINVDEFISKVLKLYEENTKNKNNIIKDSSYSVILKKLEKEFEDSDSIIKYVKSVEKKIEELIISDPKKAEEIFSKVYIFILQCISKGFQISSHRKDPEMVYKKICQDMIEFSERLEKLDFCTDKIWCTYGTYFIKEMEKCRDVRTQRLARFDKQDHELIFRIDYAQQNMYKKRAGTLVPPICFSN